MIRLRLGILSLLLLPAACTAPPERPLSPVYDRHERGDRTTVAVRPFYWRDEGPDGTKVNVFGPLIRWRENDAYRRFFAFPNVFYSARKDDPRWSFMFFPLLFLGHDDFLVFPLAGVARGLLGIHELKLYTPLYARTKSVRRPGKTPVVFITHHVLWPILAWGSDDRPHGRRKFRVWPFYGRSTRGAVAHEEVESTDVDGGSEKDNANEERSGFVLWPFYTWRKGKERDEFFVFPFYGRKTTPTREETTVMFPFYHRVEDHLSGFRDVALWPFYRRAGGTDQGEIRRLWPFYQYVRAGTSTNEFKAWPFWRRRYIETDREFARHTYFVPFYKRIDRVSKHDGRRHRKTTVWPFARVENYADGTREIAVPVLLPHDGPKYREVAETVGPLVRLYHRRAQPNGDRETSILFGLIQNRRKGANKKTHILGGLLGWGRQDGQRYFRFLWALRLRLGKRA